jgi:uncharacterized HAD superfamily protein
MKIYVDIDGTICTDNGARPKTKDDYIAAMPMLDRIEKINLLYDQGHEIHYWTARGATSGVDWTEITNQQLDSWGCKYHQLHMNSKPHFDLYICDKSFNADEWFTRNLYAQIAPPVSN